MDSLSKTDREALKAIYRLSRDGDAHTGVLAERLGLQAELERRAGAFQSEIDGKVQGVLVTKVFHGSGYSQLVKLFKETFRIAKPLKPKASRDKSSETFLVGIGLKSGKQMRPEAGP